MSHHSLSRRFRPSFDSLSARSGPTGGANCSPMDPVAILPTPPPPAVVQINPMPPTLVLNVVVDVNTH